METASAARPYVVGVGAANLDIHGRPKKAIVMHDSNPGHMNASAGGVTRNVCDNLARLGADVRLISAVGTDLYADVIRQASMCPSSAWLPAARPPPIFPFLTSTAICSSPSPI